MNFDHLQLFRDIALQRSVSKGAQMNGVSQSAASQHISEIEGRLGTPLLDRTTRPLVLTKAGRLYLDMCRDVLRRSEEFHAAIDLGGVRPGRGTIARRPAGSVGPENALAGFSSALLHLRPGQRECGHEGLRQHPHRRQANRRY